ncbi:hypothetical protein GALMADRAFT_225249 [Galerina marginata CBS 339.88]|uniref:F-box domain-containing protein n=1 Tax=Galerina marginata (strain CBS 339.88) TaxID=685588 RepID=A0A067TB52_GALM3|nr:hypothetical protein GALMADRAFT_225249 [Galerina marginata CBS 339.88]
MHRAIQIQEVLLMIFHHVRENNGTSEDERSSKAALVNLALTCSGLLEPALDTLWLSMSSLLPLIKCLPEHTTQLTPVEKQPGFSRRPPPILEINDNVQDRDFDRLLYYAPRIKILNIVQEDCNLGCKTYEGLLSHKPIAGPILRNVRSLNIPLGAFEKSAALPQLLFGAKMEALCVVEIFGDDLRGDEWNNVARLLDGLDCKKTISNLALDAFTPYEFNLHIAEPVQFRFSELTRFTGLKKLDLAAYNLNVANIAPLGQIPGLEALCISMLEAGPHNLPTVPDGYFRELKSLEISVSDATVISNLVEQWAASELESLLIERVDRSQFWDLTEIFRTLGQRLSPTSLKKLELKNHWKASFSDPYNNNTSEVSNAALSNLYPFHELVKLSINLGGRVTFGNAVLPQIAASFPRLERLEFYERELSVPSIITPSAICLLVQSLPDLQHLTLRFNARFGFPAQNLPFSQKLRCLNVLTSDATDAPRISNFLDVCFPSLKYLGRGWNYWDSTDGHNMEYLMTPQESARAEIFDRCWEAVYQRLPRCERLFLPNY